VAASRDLIRADPQRAKDESLRNQQSLLFDTLRRVNNDTRKLSRLSKIAHKRTPGKNEKSR
jgi:hypothetical protein